MHENWGNVFYRETKLQTGRSRFIIVGGRDEEGQIIFGPLAKSRIVTISFVTSVISSVRTKQLGSHRTNIQEV